MYSTVCCCSALQKSYRACTLIWNPCLFNQHTWQKLYKVMYATNIWETYKSPTIREPKKVDRRSKGILTRSILGRWGWWAGAWCEQTSSPPRTPQHSAAPGEQTSCPRTLWYPPFCFLTLLNLHQEWCTPQTSQVRQGLPKHCTPVVPKLPRSGLRNPMGHKLMSAHWKTVRAATKSVAKKPETLKAEACPVLVQQQEMTTNLIRKWRKPQKLAFGGSGKKLLQRNRMRDW